MAEATVCAISRWPVSSPPPLPSPPGTEAAAGKRGCWKVGLAGCGIIVLLAVAGFIALGLYARRNPEKFTDLMMKQIETHYSSDVTSEERERLQAAYGDFRKALREGRVSQRSVERLRGILLTSKNDVTREQVQALTEIFREAVDVGKAPALPARPAVSSATPTAIP